MSSPARADDAFVPVTGFPPISDRRARVLVLGSVPSVASLRAVRYYAHPRNAFWPIMGVLCGAGPDLDYAVRAARLRRAGVALWDVLRRCVRPGSLDSDIDPASIEPNDFGAFFARHPRIRAVFCNGGAAYACYRRHVLPGLPAAARELPLAQLPSTSPAHAARTQRQKLLLWRSALAPFLAPPAA